jgi:hypothetical protein
MSLFRGTLRPEPIASDEAIRRYIDVIRARIEPDPLFRRRLRGTMLNQFVAMREGMIVPARSPRAAMGRIGRSCLYASVTLAMSVGVTMAASQAALPGDPLYGLKLRIEALRMIAVPAEFHDELAVYALSERIHELEQVADAGEWAKVEALAGPIQHDYVALARAGVNPGSTASALSARLTVLDTLLDRLPPRAQKAIAHAMEGAPGLIGDPAPPADPLEHPGRGEPRSGGANNDGTNPNGSTNMGGANNDGTNRNGPMNKAGANTVGRPPQVVDGAAQQAPEPKTKPPHGGRHGGGQPNDTNDEGAEPDS